MHREQSQASTTSSLSRTDAAQFELPSRKWVPRNLTLPHLPAKIKCDDASRERSSDNSYGTPQEAIPKAKGPPKGYSSSDRQDQPRDKEQGRQAEDESKNNHSCAWTRKKRPSGQAPMKILAGTRSVMDSGTSYVFFNLIYSMSEIRVIICYKHREGLERQRPQKPVLPTSDKTK